MNQAQPMGCHRLCIVGFLGGVLDGAAGLLIADGRVRSWTTREVIMKIAQALSLLIISGMGVGCMKYAVSPSYYTSETERQVLVVEYKRHLGIPFVAQFEKSRTVYSCSAEGVGFDSPGRALSAEEAGVFLRAGDCEAVHVHDDHWLGLQFLPRNNGY
jgi:hypothetical protein